MKCFQILNSEVLIINEEKMYKDNLDILDGIPIAGICVVSAIMKAPDPALAAKELRAQAEKQKSSQKIHKKY